MSKSKKEKQNKKKGQNYRRCVGAVIFNRDGKVFVAERRDAPGAWQLPQGGMDPDEKPKTALLREVEEEIGTTSVEIIDKAKGWLKYDLPAEIRQKKWKGKYKGQKQKWFALRFLGGDGDIDLEASGHPEFASWKWVNLEDIPDMIVPFKRKIYKDLVKAFREWPEKIKSI